MQDCNPTGCVPMGFPAELGPPAGTPRLYWLNKTCLQVALKLRHRTCVSKPELQLSPQRYLAQPPCAKQVQDMAHQQIQSQSGVTTSYIRLHQPRLQHPAQIRHCRQCRSPSWHKSTHDHRRLMCIQGIRSSPKPGAIGEADAPAGIPGPVRPLILQHPLLAALQGGLDLCPAMVRELLPEVCVHSRVMAWVVWLAQTLPASWP